VSFTFGVEEEAFIVDADTLKHIAYRSKSLKKALKASDLNISSEIYDCQIELKTKVHRDFNCLAEELIQNRQALRNLLKNFNLDLFINGSMPDFDVSNAWCTPKDYYLNYYYSMCIYTSCMQFLSTQFHVASDQCHDYSAFINVIGELSPIFLNLSASSPFYHYSDNAYHSNRFIEYRKVPMLLDIVSGDCEQVRGAPYPIYGTLRATPYNTLELRVCDSIRSIQDCLSLLALYVSLFDTLLSSPPQHLSFFTSNNPFVYHNHWYASIHPPKDYVHRIADQKKLYTLNEMMIELVDFITPSAKKLGCLSHLDHLFQMIEVGNDAIHQKKIKNELHSFYGLKRKIIEEAFVTEIK